MVDKNVNLRVRTTGAKKAETAFAGIGKSLGAMVLSIGSATAAFKILQSSINKASEQEQIFRKLKTSIELTGRSYRNVHEDMKEYFEQLQRVTQYGDTDSAKVLTTLVQLTGDYDKSLKMLPLTLDIASTGLFDVNTAARNVAMTMEGNIELMARYLPQLKASVTPFLKTATMAEKAAFAVDLLNEKFGGTAIENAKSYAGQMSILGNRVDDLQEKFGNLFIKMAQDTGVIAAMEKGVRELERSWWNLSPAVLAYNLIVGETAKAEKEGGWDQEGWRAKKRAILDEKKALEDEAKAHVEGLDQKIQAEIKFAETMAKLNIVGMEEKSNIIDRMGFGERAEEGLIKVKKRAEETLDTLGDTSGIVAQWDTMANTMAGTFDYVFTETLINEQNFGDAMVSGLASMFQRMAATIAANAALFGFMSLITGGGFAPVGGALNFITGGIFSHDGGGFSPSRSSGGGSTTNINMPNVTMINSRSIGQIKQALSLHDRRH